MTTTRIVNREKTMSDNDERTSEQTEGQTPAIVGLAIPGIATVGSDEDEASNEIGAARIGTMKIGAE
jgi:hypothetical protein